jgi:GNAT superfamily N-acetyltransferase
MAKRRSRTSRNPGAQPHASRQEEPVTASPVPSPPGKQVYSWESRMTHVPEERMFTWESQVTQYPETGPPGISYFRGQVTDEVFVDCLLYRDETGELVGILNHYPTALPPYERQGGRNIWVHPDRRRQGIGTALILEAQIRFGRGPGGDPKLTNAGLSFMRALEDRYGGTELDERVIGRDAWMERMKERTSSTDVPDPPDRNANR